MKKVILIPIILGSVLLIGGGVVFGLAIYKNATGAKAASVTTPHDLSEKTFDKFQIDLKTAEFEVKMSDNGEKKVICEETNKNHHNVKVENDTLYITQIDDTKWYEKIFNFNFEKIKVTVYVPAGEYDNMTIKSSTGSITIPNDFTFNTVSATLSTGATEIKADVKDEIKVKASTGAVYLADLSAKNTNVECSTGGVKLDNVDVQEKIFVKVSTGNIKFNNVTAKDIETKSSTGNVTYTSTKATNSIVSKTSTGDVKFEDSDAASLNIETDTGDVTGTLLTGKTFDCQSDTGKVKYPDSTIGAGLCKIRTDTGKIDIKVKA